MHTARVFTNLAALEFESALKITHREKPYASIASARAIVRMSRDWTNVNRVKSYLRWRCNRRAFVYDYSYFQMSWL